ncbi:MAG: FAD:protein FMN transferase [Thermoleophilia bacterium]|nr:FAD:protein FMN transferase [Thermoleophilia bacterium]
MSRLRFPAMGTDVEVLIPSQDVAAGHRVRELFEEWESVLSRFRPDSELSRVNASGGGVASPLLAEAVGAALLAAHASGGLFDPGLAVQLSQAGYDRPFTEMDPSSPLPAPAAARPGGDWRRVLLTDRRLLRLPPGMHLDLGGIAKGMAVDAAVTLMRRLEVPGGVVSAGGDLAVWGLPPRGRSWGIDVDAPVRTARVPLRRGALATSGTQRRRWETTDGPAHHTIDPRTGRPAVTDLVSASVVASRCREAEVAATAALVLGAEDGAAFLTARGLHGLLVRRDGPPATVGAWPARDRAEVNR